jgi:hypothetical protein
MRKPILAAVAAATMITGTVGLAAPAEARVSTGVAVGAGLLGLGVGAAIASDHPHHYYYDDGYYAPPPPPPPPAPVAYYAPPPPPPPPAYSYEYVQRCRVVDHWSPYWGRYVQSRRCD